MSRLVNIGQYLIKPSHRYQSTVLTFRFFAHLQLKMSKQAKKLKIIQVFASVFVLNKLQVKK